MNILLEIFKFSSTFEVMDRRLAKYFIILLSIGTSADKTAKDFDFTKWVLWFCILTHAIHTTLVKTIQLHADLVRE